MSYTPTVDTTDRYATVDIAGERFTYPASTATIAGVAAPIRGNNLLKASNNFSDSAWTKSATTIGDTIDVTLDDGTAVTMTKIVENSSTAQHILVQTTIAGDPAISKVHRFYVTGDGVRTHIVCYMANSGFTSTVNTRIRIDTGAIEASGATGTGVVGSVAVTAVGTYSGRTIYEVVFAGLIATVADTAFRADVYIYNAALSYLGNGSAGVYIAQAQLTEGTEATTYNETSSQKLADGDDFTTSNWTKTRSSITAAAYTATLTDGSSLVMSKLVESGAGDGSSSHFMQQLPEAFVSGTTYTAKIKAKAAGRGFLRINAGNTTTWAADSYFDLSGAGSVSSTAFGTAAIELLGDGVYECRVSGVSGASATTNLTVTLANTGSNSSYTGDASSGVYIAEALMYTGDYTLPQEFANEARPRISGDGQRLTYSGELSNAAWTKTNVTGVSAGSIAYTNAATLDTGEVLSMAGVYETVTNSTHRIFQTSDVSATVPSIAKVRLKQLSDRDYSLIRVLNASSVNDYVHATIRFSTGTINSSGNAGTATGASASIEALGDGVYEVTLSGTPSTTAGSAQLSVYCVSDAVTTAFAGDVTKGVYIAEPIIVAGTVAPSYTRSYADRLASGGSTTGRAYVQIPHIDEFDAAGDHIGTRWNTEQTWAVTDGTSTATSTESFAPPDAGAFGSVGVGPYSYPPDGVTPGDDAYINVLTGSGAVDAPSFGYSPSEASTFRSMGYSVIDGEWLPNSEYAASPTIDAAVAGGRVPKRFGFMHRVR